MVWWSIGLISVALMWLSTYKNAIKCRYQNWLTVTGNGRGPTIPTLLAMLLRNGE